MSLVALAGKILGNNVVTNHVCTTQTKCLSPCLNVLVGGIPVHHVTGVTIAHTWFTSDGDCEPALHTGVLSPNTSTVFVYPAGAPVQIARAGDAYSVCTGVIAPSTRNLTVFAY